MRFLHYFYILNEIKGENKHNFSYKHSLWVILCSCELFCIKLYEYYAFFYCTNLKKFCNRFFSHHIQDLSLKKYKIYSWLLVMVFTGMWENLTKIHVNYHSEIHFQFLSSQIQIIFLHLKTSNILMRVFSPLLE